MTVEMYIFLAIIQMGHVRDTMKDQWSTLEQFSAPFYSTIMKCDQFLHI